MNVPHASKLPSPGTLANLRVVALSAALSFCVWFGGGWLLAGAHSWNGRDIEIVALVVAPSVVGLCWRTRRPMRHEIQVASHFRR